jgi:pyruvate/oxaloacetate carboxyltransferase
VSEVEEVIVYVVPHVGEQLGYTTVVTPRGIKLSVVTAPIVLLVN